MEQYNLGKEPSFFNSWKFIAFFIFVVFFQPTNIALYAFRFSDLLLFLALLFQVKNENPQTTNFKEYKTLFNLGIAMGSIAFISTFFEYLYLAAPIKSQIFAHFYRWFRFTLILLVVINIPIGKKDYEKLIRFFVVMLLIYLPFVYFEFYDLFNVKYFIVNTYLPVLGGGVIASDEYIYSFEREVFTYRAVGFTGNANMSAILYAMASSILFANIMYTKKLMSTIFNLIFLFGSLTAIFIVFGSRTAIVVFVFNTLLFLYLNQKDKTAVTLKGASIMIASVILFIILLSADLIQGRIISTVEEYDDTKSVAAVAGRDEFWQSRIDDFIKFGNPASIFIGLGYTKIIEDFADNGFLGTFLNLGIVGLYFHLSFIFIILKQYKNVKMVSKFVTHPLIFFMILTSSIYFESTADPLENFKYAQFYVLMAVLLYKSLNEMGVLEREEAYGFR